MQPFRNILVDIDATATAQPALERAILLAKKSGARLTIVDTVSVPTHAHLPAGIEDRLLQDRRLELARVAGAVTDVPVDSKLLVGRPATALIEEVLRAKHDLVMRSHARDVATSGRSGFGAVDMELLRNCPSPVLLVRHGQPATKPRIACAVDVGSDEAEVRALNVRIVELGLLMAEYLGSDAPALLHAWIPYGEATIRRHSTDDEFASYVESQRQRATLNLSLMSQALAGRIDEGALVLRRGEPAKVIPEFVVSEGIDVLVMGTVARRGIPGMLMGNTAERVLRKLPCTVLTVKPDWFVSPVRLEPKYEW